MAGRTITRADLAEAICRKLNATKTVLSRAEAGRLIDQIIEEVSASLERGESVRLSSFGTFEVRQKKERVGRNPKTGQEVPIKERRVATFRSSDVLKGHINDGAGAP